MKRFLFGLFMFSLIAVLGISVVAKTYREEFVSVEEFDYTLEEDDKLSAVLIIDEDGLYSVKISDLSSDNSSNPEISITVYDGNDEIYFFETGRTPNLSHQENEVQIYEFVIGLKEGEYKLVIENLTLFSDVSFKFQSDFFETEDIETNVNTGFDSATPMEFKTKYSGGVTMFGESDFYSFEMPYNGYVFIEMYSPSLKYFTLYDCDGNEAGNIAIEIPQEDKVYSLRSGLAKGKYFIEVTPEENYTSPMYTLKVTAYEGEGFEKEFNNTHLTAMNIEFGKEYQGNMFGHDDKDIYSFTLYEDSGVVIDFTDFQISKEKHYSITLTDGQTEIFSSKECGKKTVAENLSKGTYYFTVESLGYKNYTNSAYSVKFTADNRLAICPPEETAKQEESKPLDDADESVKEENVTIQFSDVKQTAWYAEDLLKARSEGLIQGLENNTYNPSGNVTLAEAITMAARLHSKKFASQVDFGASDGKWYKPYVTYALEQGLIAEKAFDNFESPATRAEIAYIFSGIFGDTEAGKNTLIPDVNENTKYCDSIHKLYALGILKGDDDKGTFYPERNLSRAEAAVILLRVSKV